eukprot:1154332-Pelagomonas_calceolata.AAC.2
MIGEGNSSPGPVSADVVLQVLTGSLSIEFSTRAQAEQMLRMWEADAAPGFVSSLLRIVEQRGAIDEVRRGHGVGLLRLFLVQQQFIHAEFQWSRPCQTTCHHVSWSTQVGGDFLKPVAQTVELTYTDNTGIP